MGEAPLDLDPVCRTFRKRHQPINVLMLFQRLGNPIERTVHQPRVVVPAAGLLLPSEHPETGHPLREQLQKGLQKKIRAEATARRPARVVPSATPVAGSALSATVTIANLSNRLLTLTPNSSRSIGRTRKNAPTVA